MLVVLGIVIFRMVFDPFRLPLLALLIIAFLFSFKKRRKCKNELEDVPSIKKSTEEHYESIGMSPQEINFFRDTMNTTKKQIVQLQANMNKSTKLRAIDLRNDTLRVSKALFKEIVKEPKKLHLANHFLYTHLPNIVDLTNKFLEISDHEIKSKETYEKLEESAQIIDQVSKLIKKDYQEFVSDDLDDLDVEISVAKNSIKRDNESNN
nr:5-bromo-4-chloroindolyl phosphate hydrolysis family protein [Enterococcus rivorum]